MSKWYEGGGEYQDVVISSRVRLARNMDKYPFSIRMTGEQAVSMVEETAEAFKDLTKGDNKYYYCDLQSLNETERFALVERHMISPMLAGKKQKTAVLWSEDESDSIMVNEEDHIRIQALADGMNIKQAFLEANRLDDITYEKFHYAFDEKFGYLTSCPTNTGTGMRASYMVFLPALSADGKIQRLAGEVSKYGVAMRGIYGEGSKSLGNIYQISNQKTLGSSEKDIIANLNNIVLQVIDQERKRREMLFTNNYSEIENQIHRSYGILKYATQLNSEETMVLLSRIKLGLDAGVIKLKEDFCVYQMMMEIQPANIQHITGKNAGSAARDKMRAQVVREKLPELK